MDNVGPDAPYPWKQLVIVASCVAMATVAFVNPFPYLGFMVAGFEGVDYNGAGYATGYVASVVYLGRFCSSYFWGHMSDRFGRKPVMITSLMSVAIFPVLFGVSESLAWALCTRFLLGFFTCAATAARALAPEIAGPARAVEGMAYVTGAYAVGMTIGPGVGGLLAEPTEHLPFLVGSSPLFARYQYLLPNLVTSMIAVVFIPLVIFFVPETRMGKSGLCRRRPVERHEPLTPSGAVEADGHHGSRKTDLPVAPGTPFFGGSRFFGNPDMTPLRRATLDGHREGRSNHLTLSPCTPGTGGSGSGVLVPQTPSRRAAVVEDKQSKGSDRSAATGETPPSLPSGSRRQLRSTPSRAAAVRGARRDDYRALPDGLDTSVPRSSGPERCSPSTPSMRGHVRRGDEAGCELSATPRDSSPSGDSAGHELGKDGGDGNLDGLTRGVTGDASPISPTSSGGPQEEGGRAEDKIGIMEIEEEGVFGRGGLLQVRHVPVLLLATFLIEMCVIAFDEVFPLWALSTEEAGGLSWNTVQIGQVLTAAGVGMVLNHFIAYKWLVSTLGLVTFHRFAAVASSVLNAAMPFVAYLPLGYPGLSVISTVMIAVLNALSYSLMTAVMAALASPVPARLRGKLSGLAAASQFLGGMIGPATFAMIFAWSISTTSSASQAPLVDQHFVFNVTSLIRLALPLLLWNVLTEETLSDLVEDPVTPMSLHPPRSGSKDIFEYDMTESPVRDMPGDRRADLV